MGHIKLKANYLFEVSWEVCNKVGGIYTVVKSKANSVVDLCKDHYFVVGPYFVKKFMGQFQETEPPENFKRAFDKLHDEGIICHYGKWLIKGEPNTILIDFTNFTKNNNQIKKELWDNFKIDSLDSQYYDFDEPVIWAYSVGRLLQELSSTLDGKIVSQFHEWLAGAGLLYLKQSNCNVATVFTTHATTLGRTLASSDVDIYNVMEEINPEEEAYKHKIHTKFQMEKAAAANADVFTTVSEITAMEAEHFLGRKPDILLPNGLDMDKFPTFEDISIKHKTMKSRIREFLLYYFFPYYQFDINNTLIYFICGRYEFRDKGVDILIKALGELNRKLREEKSNKTIVTFFWIPGNIRGIKSQLLENRTNFNDIKDSVDWEMPEIKNRLIYSIVSKQEISEKLIFDEDAIEDIKRKILKLMRSGKPSLATHDLYNEESDEILNAFKENGLNNEEEDRVKVVFYSIYLTGADGLLDTSYYESMLGSQLGIFPSYYEPWGYTPLEAGALGVPAITTDLAGFGRFILKEVKQTKPLGIYVLNRCNRQDDEIINELTKILYNYAHMSKEERVKNKIEAKRVASKADWKNFVQNYIKAHNKAFDKKWS